jgi:hypothetical protein
MRAATVTCLVLAARLARADVSYEVKLPDAAHGNAAPTIEVTVVGGPRLPQDKYTLRDADARPPIELHATAKRDFAQGNETLALAIVLDTWEMWIGNDDVIRDDDPDLARLASRTPGILKPLEQALDGVRFADAGPPGSVAFVVSYGDRATVRVPVEPLATLTGAQLGSQHDYFGTKRGELVKGVELALARLHDLTAARKVLIVIGDGHDTSDDAARVALRNAKTTAAQDRIQTFAIIYKAPLSDVNGPGNAITALVANTTTVNTADNIASSIAAILSRLDDRYYLTFPGWDAARGVGLAWDGGLHHLVLAIDKEDQDAGEVVLAPAWTPHRDHAAWVLVLGAVAAAALIGALAIALTVVVVRRRAARAQRPTGEAAPAASAAVAMKTVMIGAGGDREGFPVVGWLVPLNGQTAYQTFRLRTGVTLIGTGRIGSDIVIDDGFMSTRHCEIAASPCGFTLSDAGSTNGSYVNDHRVERHELVDNDLVTLGKTCFRFKSIS